MELAIRSEIAFLKNSIYPYKKDHNPLNLQDDFYYRAIATLIVSGTIKVTEYAFDVNKFLNKIEVTLTNNNSHGGDWHNNTIQKVAKYYSDLGHIVNSSQPSLLYGYADLLLQKNGNSIYIEIDTINIFKLWINLSLMKNACILNMTPNKIIKFDL